MDNFAIRYRLTDDDASGICASCECDRVCRRPRLRQRQQVRPFCPQPIHLLQRQWPLQCQYVWRLSSYPLRGCVYVARSRPDPSLGLTPIDKQREILKSVSTISFYAYAFTPSSKSNWGAESSHSAAIRSAFQIRPLPVTRIMRLAGPTRRVFAAIRQ